MTFQGASVLRRKARRPIEVALVLAVLVLGVLVLGLQQVALVLGTLVLGLQLELQALQIG